MVTVSVVSTSEVSISVVSKSSFSFKNESLTIFLISSFSLDFFIILLFSFTSTLFLKFLSRSLFSDIFHLPPLPLYHLAAHPLAYADGQVSNLLFAKDLAFAQSFGFLGFGDFFAFSCNSISTVLL